MQLRDELIAYQVRWANVDAQVKEQRRKTSMELRWRQLNAAYAMAVGLGLLQEDNSDVEVIEKWAKLKEKSK